MLIVAAEVVTKYGNVVHNATLAVALIESGLDVKAGDVVSDFAIVGICRFEY